jgi:thymidylate synthase ThyX
MSLNKSFLKKDTKITAKVVCDSVCTNGVRITTLEVEYPRFIHSELMTHRMISKNCSSSRAIPINKMVDQILNNMAVPEYFGANKSGMQAVEEVQFPDLARKMWIASGRQAVEDSLTLAKDFNIHKQISNRITEPFQMMKVLLTATEWDNFFNLRIEKDAQPEIVLLAYKIYTAMQDSNPVEIQSGEWHLPYIERGFDSKGEIHYYLSTGEEVDLETAKKISASCSAQTSYRKNDESVDKAIKIFDMLINAEVKHSSPFEHLATPRQAEQVIENSDFDTVGHINFVKEPDTWEFGLTHSDRYGNLWSGNLKGWVSYRHKFVKDNTCNSFNFENRIKEFENE